MNRYEALKHAAIAHAEQRDKCGRPYILHPIAVAEAVDRTELQSGDRRFDFDWMAGGMRREAAVVVALLHDVWEDTDYGPLPGMNEPQARAMALITRYPNETYAEYIEAVCADFVASIVKLADLWHNLSPERQACLPERERKGLEKRYLKARERIWEALGYRWWPEPMEAVMVQEANRLQEILDKSKGEQ